MSRGAGTVAVKVDEGFWRALKAHCDAGTDTNEVSGAYLVREDPGDDSRFLLVPWEHISEGTLDSVMSELPNSGRGPFFDFHTHASSCSGVQEFKARVLGDPSELDRVPSGGLCVMDVPSSRDVGGAYVRGVLSGRLGSLVHTRLGTYVLRVPDAAVLDALAFASEESGRIREMWDRGRAYTRDARSLVSAIRLRDPESFEALSVWARRKGKQLQKLFRATEDIYVRGHEAMSYSSFWDAWMEMAKEHSDLLTVDFQSCLRIGDSTCVRPYIALDGDAVHDAVLFGSKFRTFDATRSQIPGVGGALGAGALALSGSG